MTRMMTNTNRPCAETRGWMPQQSKGQGHLGPWQAAAESRPSTSDMYSSGTKRRSLKRPKIGGRFEVNKLFFAPPPPPPGGRVSATLSRLEGNGGSEPTGLKRTGSLADIPVLRTGGRPAHCLAGFNLFWSLYALTWVQNGSAHVRDMPPSNPPHSSPINPPPAFPTDPPVQHCQSQTCRFQGFFGACTGSYGSNMAQNGLKPLV